MLTWITSPSDSGGSAAGTTAGATTATAAGCTAGATWAAGWATGAACGAGAAAGGGGGATPGGNRIARPASAAGAGGSSLNAWWHVGQTLSSSAPQCAGTSSVARQCGHWQVTVGCTVGVMVGLRLWESSPPRRREKPGRGGREG